MQTTSKPEIPSDLKKLKKEYWSNKQQIKDYKMVNQGLKIKLDQCQKALALADGLIMEIDSKRREPGLLDDIKSRLKAELLKLDVNKVMNTGAKKEIIE
jgi:hypothetical protein